MNTYSKSVIPRPDFYIAKFTKNFDAPYLVFVHGGPGLNCGVIEYLIEHHHLFGHLNFNIVLYDQRHCGRSKNISSEIVHDDNVNDLSHIIVFLTNDIGLPIQGLIGHSYGAKLLFDFYQKFSSSLPAVFISLAHSIITPRLNNLMLDLAYLKKESPDQYSAILKDMDHCSLEKIWEMSEVLEPIFEKNRERIFLYWANLEMLDAVTRIQKKINLPMNKDVFSNVRKSLYLSEDNLDVSIEKLKIPYLWVNGFHDFIMNNGNTLPTQNNKKIITFYQSAHYPHIEENSLFCEYANKFLSDSWSQMCDKK